MKNRLIPVFALTLACLANSACAHFPFVVPDSNGATAKVLMSETLEPDAEVKIETLTGIVLSQRDAKGTDTPLTSTPAEHALSVALPGDGTRIIHGKADLGFMQRGEGKPHRLVYYPKTVVGDAFDPKTTLGESVPVELVPVRSDAGIKLRLDVTGKPQAEKEVQVILPDGSQDTYKTDVGGLTPEFKNTGRYGAWARNWVDSPGEVSGKKYEQLREYATLVFDFSPAPSPAAAAVISGANVRPFVSLPHPVASFGAVASDGWLYVFGGHVADRHEYSTATVSGDFQRLNLREPAKWEKLTGGGISQGLNLATHNGKIYRAGGMQPRNAPGTEADNYSLDVCERFDPTTGNWEALPKLLKPRSSHDLAVVGNKLFVIGGWTMKGRGQESEWLNTMEVLDLDTKEPSWQTIAQPFSRRALIVSVVNQKIFVIGGFDEFDTPQLDVDIYDVEKGAWTKGPPIPGTDRNGFSPAACTFNGSVYLSVATGDMFKLSDDQSKWNVYAKTTPRIVHRLIPTEKEILVVGGASNAKMVDLIEAVAASNP